MTAQYSGKDVTFSVGGKVMLIQSVKYSVKQSKKKIWSMGAPDPISTTKGKKEYSGQIELLQSEFEAFVRGIPSGKDLTDLAPMDMTVVYFNLDNLMVTDILVGAEFTSMEKAIKVDDDNMIIPLPFEFSALKLNVK